jgi:hypothetical protein
MVKVYGPLLSMDASGTIANAATFSKWKGRNYVRSRVVPSNPKTGPQVGMRASLKFLSQIWFGLTTVNKATWTLLAAATNISPFNAFTSYNQRRWRSHKSPTKSHPAAEVGAIASAPTTTPAGGIRQIQLSIADGATPPTWGWIIYRAAVTGFTPAYSNCIALIPRTATPTIFVDAPLVAGTYYYRIQGYTDDGVLGTLEVERTAAAT